MRCSKCGADLKPDAKFCGKCGTMLSSDPIPTSSTTYHIPLVIGRMPQGIALGAGERIVKQYRIGEYTFRQGSIEVIVTNKRVIRYEESSWLGMQNNQIDEINIDAVHGNYTRMCRSISILGLITTIFFLIIGFVALYGKLYSSYNKTPMEYLIGIIALTISSVIILRSLKPTLEFALLGSIGGPALGTLVNKRGRIVRSDSNSIIFQFKPTDETTVMLKEIGACIFDLKTLGDKAIDKWN